MAKTKLLKKGQEIDNVEDLGNGYYRITFTDGSMVIVSLVPLSMSVEGLDDESGEEEDDDDGVDIEDMKEALTKGKHVTKKKLKKMDEEEIEELYNEHFGEEEEEEDDEEDDSEITPEILQEADFDDLEDIVDEHELDIDVEDYEEDEEKLRKEVAKALGIKLPKAKGKKKK